ncbi:EAL domain-containing protein [Ferrimicrobium sp.]|uniref:EAL domain-containing protein n=1 Tax=Ferrimicrobium sp. TaxID=2926050 RepID=UPI0026245EE6|nr:EAL domain-containing protein [Ferrimicrobium sp.]
MGCETCQKFVPAESKLGDRQVLIIHQDELRRKVASCLRGEGIGYRLEGDALKLQGIDLARVVSLLGHDGNLTSYQREQIHVITLDPSTTADIDQLNSVTTIEHLLGVQDAPDVQDCLEREALETHFQPIVSVESSRVIGYEALSRGRTRSGALIPPLRLFSYAQKMDAIFFLDRLSRETAIATAAKIGLDGWLFINFLPNAIYDPRQCLKTTLAIAQQHHFDPGRIVFEVTESQQIVDLQHLKSIFRYYRNHGFQVALDDVGSGYAGLNTIVGLLPDVIKIDRELIVDIDREPLKRALVGGLIQAVRSEGIEVVAEGVETAGELRCVIDLGATLIQGFVFAKPSAQPDREVRWPTL